MRLLELTRKVSRQQLYMYGHFNRQELRQLQKEGWRIEGKSQRQKSSHHKNKPSQINKNGILVEGNGRREKRKDVCRVR